MPTASLAGKTSNAPKIHNCSRCGLSSSCKSPKIPYTGEGRKRILIIGPSVCKAEDDSNNEKHGSSYAYLKRNLKEVGIDLELDCWYTHATRCYTKENIGLTTRSACYKLLMREIEELDPIAIVPASPEAWDVLLYERLVGRAATASYADWCGEIIPDQVLLRWVIPIYSASFVDDYNDKRYNPYILFWHKQMQNILAVSSRPKPLKLNIVPCRTMQESMAALDTALSWDAFAFDYETTGIKSFDDGHQIAYMSISNGDISFAFAIQPNPEFRNKLKQLLTNKAIKIAHNANFEREWTANILGYEVTNLIHDTMLMQHCLNNRKPTGLKFLSYSQYGYLGYDADADEYLKASTEDERARGANAFNRVFDAPVSKMLEYNAMDSLFTYWLYEDLYRAMDRDHQIPGYKFFMELSLALYHAHMNGICMDIPLMEKTGEEIESTIRPYIDKIMSDPLILQKWKSNHPFNPRSDHDIRTLLFSILKLEPTEFTNSGLPAVDADALYLYVNKVPIISPLFQIKRLSKLNGTYIRQMRAEQNSGVMHAYFNLNRVVTYRSNCVAKGSKILVNRDYDSHREGIPIEEVVVGDYVLCLGEDGNPHWGKVTWAGCTGVKKVVRIHYKGHAGLIGHLDLTPDHKVRLSSGVYVPAIELSEEYGISSTPQIKNQTGILQQREVYWNNHTVMSVEILSDPVEVYDLTVEGYHNFIANEICVHNCNNVNLQNQPKRDKESRNIIRSIYVPRRGHKLVEYDFKAMEVSIAAAVTGDKNLIKYVTDPSTDMHRDLAKKLFMVDEVSKNLRGNATKGPWTFAQFYGSYWKQCAAGVWSEIDIPNAVEVYGFDVVKHLRKCGITSYEKWEKHCEEQEYILWNEFFPGYKRWRDETFELFQEQGYVDYVNGFRYYGPASRNEVLNGPIQGSAFHVQGWAFKEMDKFLRNESYNTMLIGQVHDSILVDMDPAEEEWVDRKIHEFATIKVREHWRWITVPLVMEKDSGEVDGSWAEMKSCGVLRGAV